MDNEEKQLYTIILRHDTSTNWNINDTVLELGEYGIEDDTHRVKRGDGTTPWSELLYEDFGLEYIVTFENLTGDVNDNEALKEALDAKVNKDTFVNSNNSVLTGLGITNGEDTIAVIEKTSTNVKYNSSKTDYLYIESEDNSIKGYWTIDNTGSSVLNLKAVTTIQEYTVGETYKKNEICIYDGQLIVAEVEVKDAEETPNYNKWQILSVKDAHGLPYDSDGRTTADNAEDALDELYDKLDTKVDKTKEKDKIYGTDTKGNQTTYDINDLGKVDTVNEIEPDENRNVTITADDIMFDTQNTIVGKVADLEQYATDIKTDLSYQIEDAKTSINNNYNEFIDFKDKTEQEIEEQQEINEKQNNEIEELQNAQSLSNEDLENLEQTVNNNYEEYIEFKNETNENIEETNTNLEKLENTVTSNKKITDAFAQFAGQAIDELDKNIKDLATEQEEINNKQDEEISNVETEVNNIKSGLDTEVVTDVSTLNLNTNELLKLNIEKTNLATKAIDEDVIKITSEDNTIIAKEQSDGSIDISASISLDVSYFLTTETLDTEVGTTNTIPKDTLTGITENEIKVNDIITDPNGTNARVQSVEDNTITAITISQQIQATWGTIAGNINAQTDLQEALDKKISKDEVSEIVENTESELVDNKIILTNTVYNTETEKENTKEIDIVKGSASVTINEDKELEVQAEGIKFGETNIQEALEDIENKTQNIESDIDEIKTEQVDQSDKIDSIEEEIQNKVEQTDEVNVIYGTDEEGNQVTYDITEFGKVDTVNNITPDENKNIEITAEDIYLNSNKETTVNEKFDTIEEELDGKLNKDNIDKIVTSLNYATKENEISLLYNTYDVENDDYKLDEIDILKGSDTVIIDENGNITIDTENLPFDNEGTIIESTTLEEAVKETSQLVEQNIDAIEELQNNTLSRDEMNKIVTSINVTELNNGLGILYNTYDVENKEYKLDEADLIINSESVEYTNNSLNVLSEGIDFDPQDSGLESTKVAPAIRELKSIIGSGDKVDKCYEANTIYGTDKEGNQINISTDNFENKIIYGIQTTGKVENENYIYGLKYKYYNLSEQEIGNIDIYYTGKNGIEATAELSENDVIINIDGSGLIEEINDVDTKYENIIENIENDYNDLEEIVETNKEELQEQIDTKLDKEEIENVPYIKQIDEATFNTNSSLITGSIIATYSNEDVEQITTIKLNNKYFKVQDENIITLDEEAITGEIIDKIDTIDEEIENIKENVQENKNNIETLNDKVETIETEIQSNIKILEYTEETEYTKGQIVHTTRDDNITLMAIVTEDFISTKEDTVLNAFITDVKATKLSIIGLPVDWNKITE